MTTLERTQALVDRMLYRPHTGWRVLAKNRYPEDLVLLQHWQIIDGERQAGRKWYISPHMTDNEIVQTALLAAITFEEHEAREAFQFDGKRIFGPHISLDSQEKIRVEVRQNV